MFHNFYYAPSTLKLIEKLTLRNTEVLSGLFSKHEARSFAWLGFWDGSD